MRIIDKLCVIVIWTFTTIGALLAQSPTKLIPLEDKQLRVLDTAILSIQYKLTFKVNPKAPRGVEQYLLLKIGNRYNQFESDLSMQPIRKMSSGAAMGIPGRGLAATVILLDKQQHRRKVTVQPQSEYIYQYSEVEDYPRWSITQEEIIILGYRCLKAIGSYRGRIYTAWFTYEIPMNAGPWKLGGLPGLILKAFDEKGEYIFDCTEIKQDSKVPIHFLHSLAKAKDRRDIEKWLVNLHKNYGKVLKSQGRNIVTLDSKGNEIDGSHLSFPYNPIELE